MVEVSEKLKKIIDLYFPHSLKTHLYGLTNVTNTRQSNVECMHAKHNNAHTTMGAFGSPIKSTVIPTYNGMTKQKKAQIT